MTTHDDQSRDEPADIDIIDDDDERIINDIENSLETRLHEITVDQVMTTKEVYAAFEILKDLMGTLPRLYVTRLEEARGNIGDEESVRRIRVYEDGILNYYKRIIIEEDGKAANIQKYSEKSKYIAIPKGVLLQMQRVLGLAVNKMDREKEREGGFYQSIKGEAEREDIPFTETALRSFVGMDLGRRETGHAILVELSDPGFTVVDSFYYIAKKYYESTLQRS